MSDRLKLLLIDDDEEDFLIIADMLAETGGAKYKLDWVNTYEGALEEFSRARHDVYLLDYLLGAYNGLDPRSWSWSTSCS